MLDSCGSYQEFADDGVAYLELRTTPKELPETGIWTLTDMLWELIAGFREIVSSIFT